MALIKLLTPEAIDKIKDLKIDPKKDRVRIIFEFEFKDGKIHDAVEVPHRRLGSNENFRRSNCFR